VCLAQSGASCEICPRTVIADSSSRTKFPTLAAMDFAQWRKFDVGVRCGISGRAGRLNRWWPRERSPNARRAFPHGIEPGVRSNLLL
jgi:hypothetical protein